MGAKMLDGTFGSVLYLVLLLVAVAGWVAVEYRQRLGLALRTALAWALLFLGVAAAYGIWTDLRGAIHPRQEITGTNEITLQAAPDGHYYAQLVINGAPVDVIADTGATNLVLSRADAERAGIDLSRLVFLGQATTANGVVRTARVTLKQVEFGPFSDRNVPAYVTDGALDGSLLGMDYLQRFSIRIDGGRMTLSR